MHCIGNINLSQGNPTGDILLYQGPIKPLEHEAWRGGGGLCLKRISFWVCAPTLKFLHN